MKFFFLASSFVLLSHCVLAQVAEGNKFANGTVNLFLGENLSQVVIAPQLGYFINNQIAVGGSVGLAYSSVGDGGNVSVTLAPFIRRYFPIVDDKFFFFLNGSIVFAYGNYSIGGLEMTGEDTFSISLNAAPGFIYFPSERWSLDFTLSGLSLNFISLDENPSVALLLGASTVSPGLGFSYYF
ncbi:hypothetical protein [Tunicatimonas pelagia]|uniref:hypothetical protein n=1 Tax=Tunicatimonas pelagia TaxID=931531 RepID=UPI0026661BEE|nr:hypothetical protein [Tunicatimonas pelagia]WKN41026.1 hypothetical protein P0M28_18490 [Tunicatimonas pelagia]